MIPVFLLTSLHTEMKQFSYVQGEIRYGVVESLSNSVFSFKKIFQETFFQCVDFCFGDGSYCCTVEFVQIRKQESQVECELPCQLANSQH